MRAGHWAGIHLALAGAALVAVGTFMPHFGVTLAGTRPESGLLRIAGVISLAMGAALVVSGVSLAANEVALFGAGLVWLGLAITVWATFHPMRHPLARRHPIVAAAYGVALAEVSIGIGLPVLMLAGWEPAMMAWRQLKPAHVWLNLFGFMSLTISATLVYLYPTVLGARIRVHASLVAMIGGGMAGPLVVAGAALLDSQALGVIGGLVTFAGAVGQGVYAADVWRRRGRWTTDANWHAASIGHISAGMGWYLAAVVTAVVGIIRDGVAPVGWGIGALAIPLVAGWAMQILVGAWSHLLPAVGSGDPGARARQRGRLGAAARPRIVAWNAAVLFAWLGLGGAGIVPMLIGVLGFAASAAAAVGVLLWALAPPGGLAPRADRDLAQR